MRIDSSGNLLVGKTTGSNATAGAELNASGQIVGTFASGTHILGRNTNDGSILELHKDGTTVGSIGTKVSSSYIGTEGTGVLFWDSQKAITPYDTNATVVNNSIDLGAVNYKFKDLYLAGGVYLGGTAAANHLDDYEEGTFTPTWTPASGSGQTIVVASGWYTKTGNRVFIDIYIATNGLGTASGNLSLGGLPFVQTTNAGQNASLSCGQASNANLVAGQAGAARIQYNSTTITPLVWSATTGTTTMTVAQWGVSGTWRFTGSYQV
jgi:hypothetical protein